MATPGFGSLCLDRVKHEIDDHLCFWATLVLAAYVFLNVPQVAHVWRQAEPAGMGWLYVPFAGFIALVILYYLLSVVTVLRPLPMRRRQVRVRRWCRRDPEAWSRRLVRWTWLVPEVSCRLLPAIRRWLWRRRSGARRVRVATAVLLVAVVIFFYGAPPDGSSLYPLGAVLCRNVSLFALLVGLWLMAPTSTRREHHVGPAVGRWIGWALVTSAFGEIVWILSAHGLLGFSYRLFSIWAFCHLFVLAVLVALLLHQGDPQRVDPDEPRRSMRTEQRAAASAAEPAPVAWRDELLARTPVGEQPIFGGAAPAGVRTFADNVVLISSVSGGSLATADFVHERLRGRHLERVEESANSTASELVTLGRRNRLDEIDRWLALLEGLLCLELHAEAPLLRGVLSVSLERGDALARFWTEAFEWHGATDRRGPAAKVPWPAARRAPCAIYDATDVAQGRRRAIGFPPLPADPWTADEGVALAQRLRHVVLGALAPRLELVLALDAELATNGGGPVPPAANVAARILEELQRRRLLVLEIDAGKAEVLSRYLGQISLWDRSRRELVAAAVPAPARPDRAGSPSIATQNDLDRRAKAGNRLDVRQSRKKKE